MSPLGELLQLKWLAIEAQDTQTHSSQRAWQTKKKHHKALTRWLSNLSSQNSECFFRIESLSPWQLIFIKGICTRGILIVVFGVLKLINQWKSWLRVKGLSWSRLLLGGRLYHSLGGIKSNVNWTKKNESWFMSVEKERLRIKVKILTGTSVY